MILLKNLTNISFTPYKRYGQIIKGIYWYNINYNDDNGIGTYILKFDAGSKTKFHKHMSDENFFILEGTLNDSETKETFIKGNFISLKEGSSHYSYSKDGCILLVFSQGHIKRY